MAKLKAVQLQPLQMVLAATFDMVHEINRTTMQTLAGQVEITNRPESLEYVNHISKEAGAVLDNQFQRMRLVNSEIGSSYMVGEWKLWSSEKFFRILSAVNKWKLGATEVIVQNNTLVENLKKYLTFC